MEAQQLQLKDFHFPEVISWWPPAIGWWVLVVVIPLCCWGLFKLFKRLTRKTAVKTAKKILHRLKQDGSLNEREKLIALSQLIRRVAISGDSRADTASLTGQDWLQHLDKGMKGTPFSQGEGKIIADVHYQKSISKDIDLSAVISLCETWLKSQK